MRSCAPRRTKLRRNGFPRRAREASTLSVIRLIVATGVRFSPEVRVTSSATKPFNGERVSRLKRISSPTRSNSMATSCLHFRVKPLVCPYHPAHKRKPVRAMRRKLRTRRVIREKTCIKRGAHTMRNFRADSVFYVMVPACVPWRNFTRICPSLNFPVALIWLSMARARYP